MNSENPPFVTFAPAPSAREFPGERGFWNMAIGHDSTSIPVDRREPSSPPGISICAVLIGIIVFLAMFWIFSQSTSCHKYRQGFVNGMRAVTKGKPSEVLALSSKDHHLKLDDELCRTTICRPGETNCLTNLTECIGDNCKDIKNICPKYRKSADTAVAAFAKNNKVSMLMIYAPWCPHCHTAMPKFFEAAKKSKCPYAIINAELVSPDLLRGENALFDVKFFPYIIRREQKGGEASDTVFKGAPSVEEYVKFSEMNQMDHFFA